MCGRYSLSTPADLVADLLELPETPELAPRYNIAPTQEAPVVRAVEGGRRLDLLRWGLVPFWAKDPAIGNRMINARSETAAEKPSFRTSFKRRRCLVVADGFYEWKRLGSRKQPYHIRMRDGAPFALAGLWDRWEKGGGAPLETFTILTTRPNELLAEIHDRMPVIVARADHAAWLDPAVQDPESLRPLLSSHPAAAMEANAVSTFVNSPANDSSECVRPVEPKSR